MKGRFLIAWIILIVVCVSFQAKASHIVGGEVTYKCLGNNNYQITISIYEDCLTGLPEAIAEDNPAYLNIFNDDSVALFQDENGNPAYDSIFLQSRILVPTNFNNACIDNPPATCLRKATFVKIYHLPSDTIGYTVIYQRCCRNASILNISNPSTVGATYWCYIPPAKKAICNHSAVFKNYPPQIICINNPLVYDHSATDPDGDSLSYEFCSAYAGGSNNDAKPNPLFAFDPVNYSSPYTFTKPMAGYPMIQIDPKTGLITGTPNIIGRFVVTVCCHEWRNGIMINTVTREFQFVVTNCSKAVVADIPQLSTDFNTYVVNCQDYTVPFINNSKGGFSYFWDFGDPSNKADTSTQFEPTYVYPDTGTYLVKLVVNRGSTCPDSISRFVKVYPTFKTHYSYSGLQCPGSPISFTDKTSSTYRPITTWYWSFGDSVTSAIPNPVHTYQAGGTYNVMLVTKNYKGCTDTVVKQVLVEKFKPFAGNDTTIVKGEIINFNATGGIQFTWSPATQLNDPDIANPTGTYPDTGRFSYVVHVVSPFGCTGNDTVNVLVVNQAAVFVPSGFTPNGDGRNDILRPILIGYKGIKFFDIYNRWGQQVFHSNDPYYGWDGVYNGKKADMGTYYWVIRITDRTGKDQLLKGDVTLIR